MVNKEIEDESQRVKLKGQIFSENSLIYSSFAESLQQVTVIHMLEQNGLLFKSPCPPEILV